MDAKNYNSQLRQLQLLCRRVGLTLRETKTHLIIRQVGMLPKSGLTAEKLDRYRIRVETYLGKNGWKNEEEE